MGFRIVFIKNGEYLRTRLDNLLITKNGETIYIPLSDIESIILEGHDTVVTTKLLAKLATHNINLIVSDHHYLPCGNFLSIGQYHRAAKRSLWQSQWTCEQKEFAWTAIVQQKLKNQIEVCRMLEAEFTRIELMEKLYRELEPGDKTNREGHIAKVYFNSLFGKKFTRGDDCLINHALDYGYSIIRSFIARTIVGAGLIPSLGIFHCNEYNAFNLADDLIEPFRPVLDLYAVKLLDRYNINYLSYEIRLELVNFLNQVLTVNNKKCYINQVIIDFVNSFIKMIEDNNENLLLAIDVTTLEKGQ